MATAGEVRSPKAELRSALPGPRTNPAPLPASSELELFAREKAAIVGAARCGQSLLLVGESGSGKTTLCRQAIAQLEPLGYRCALIDYTTVRETVQGIARAFNIPTERPKRNHQGEETGETVGMKIDEIKTEILANASDRWVLFADNAPVWTQSLRFWLRELEQRGVTLMLVGLKDSNKDIFLRRTRLEMSLPNIYEVREVMRRHAIAISHPLSNAELADLQQRVGLNLGIAKLVVEQHKLGLQPIRTQHSQTIVLAPYIFAALGCVAVVRFWGLGMGDRVLYMVGGICLSLFVGLRMAGRELAREKRGLGQ